MKKLLCLLLCACLTIGFCACGDKDKDDDKDKDETPSVVDDGKTTTTTTKAPATETGKWEKRYYVDEFDEPTSEWYVTNVDPVVGKFSNSATNNSTLKAMILVDEDNISIILYEYGRSQVKNYSSTKSEYYDITIKADNGKKYNYEGYIPRSSDRIVFDKSDRSAIIKLLKGGGTVSFYIEEQDRSITNYLFEVESSNFGKLVSK